MSRKRKGHKKWDDGIGPGGPVTQSAIFPQRTSTSVPMSPTELSELDIAPSPREHTDSTLAIEDNTKHKDPEKMDESETPSDNSVRGRSPRRIAIYEEGNNMVFEDEDGDVIDVQPAPGHDDEKRPEAATTTPGQPKTEGESIWSLGGMRKKMSEMYSAEVDKRKNKGKSDRKHEPARAYQFGNTIIVEDEDGEVVKTYELPPAKGERAEGAGDLLGTSLKYMGLGGLARPAEKSPEATAEEGEATGAAAGKAPVRSGWVRRKSVSQAQQEEQAADDRNIRFTIGGVGKRMTKEDFIREVQKLDSRTRREVVAQSSASLTVKRLATQEPPEPVPMIVEQAGTSSPKRSESVSPERRPAQTTRPGSRKAQVTDDGETAVERNRRLAVLANQGDEDARETPAERRRREAALGMGGGDAVDDSDDDDNSPERRGIRFAASVKGEKK